jgi:hypothetical protein
MTVALAVFRPLLAPEVPGCPVIVMKKRILDAATEFCSKSSVWLDTHTYSAYANQNPIDFDITAHEVVHEIRAAELDGEPISVQTREWCNDRYPGWRPGTPSQVTGQPAAITQLDTTSFCLVPTQTETGTLVLEVALKPRKTATLLPDILYNEYEEAIVDGALARLLNMRKAAWYDSAEATKRDGAFQAAIAKANLRQSKGFGRARMHVTARFL